MPEPRDYSREKHLQEFRQTPWNRSPLINRQLKLFHGTYSFDPHELEVGYVYVMTNELIPNLAKIGKTTRTPEERAQELKSTGVPGTWIPQYSVFTPQCDVLEQAVHGALNRLRISTEREFFRISVEDAKKELDELANSLASNFEGWPDLELVKRNIELQKIYIRDERLRLHEEAKKRKEVLALEAEIDRRKRIEDESKRLENYKLDELKRLDHVTKATINGSVFDFNVLFLFGVGLLMLFKEPLGWKFGLPSICFSLWVAWNNHKEKEKAIALRRTHSLPPVGR